MREQDGNGSDDVETRTVHIEDLKASIERHEYAVDPQAVADAILARLLRQSRCS